MISNNFISGDFFFVDPAAIATNQPIRFFRPVPAP